MPVAALSNLFGAGTFSTVVLPPTGAPCTVSATVTINIGSSAQGYVIGKVVDSISGNDVCLVGCLIEDADRAAGFKNILIQCGVLFASAASLKVNVDAETQLGAVASALISGASLNTFLAV